MKPLHNFGITCIWQVLLKLTLFGDAHNVLAPKKGQGFADFQPHSPRFWAALQPWSIGVLGMLSPGQPRMAFTASLQKLGVPAGGSAAQGVGRLGFVGFIKSAAQLFRVLGLRSAGLIRDV